MTHCVAVSCLEIQIRRILAVVSGKGKMSVKLDLNRSEDRGKSSKKCSSRDFSK